MRLGLPEQPDSRQLCAPAWVGLTCGRNAQPPRGPKPRIPGKAGAVRRRRERRGIREAPARPGSHSSSEPPHLTKWDSGAFFKCPTSFWTQSFNSCLAHCNFSFYLSFLFTFQGCNCVSNRFPSYQVSHKSHTSYEIEGLGIQDFSQWKHTFNFVWTLTIAL